MTPEPTPITLLRGLAQALQRLLASAPDQPTLLVLRPWVENWLTTVDEVLTLLDDPLAPSGALPLVGAGLVGALLALAACLLLGGYAP